jgi:pescadillo protein
LCILKGIHPREPKKKFEGHNKTYYHVKDINFLAHEPLLEKSRELKAYERKIKKARAKRNEHLADRLESNRPSYTLDHLVKERYPSFVDALRDLDDPLTMLHLFAVLPADGAHKIPVSHTQTARRLALEWQALITRTHALRKCFVSVKGIYYQVLALNWAMQVKLFSHPDDIQWKEYGCLHVTFSGVFICFVLHRLKLEGRR